MDDFVIPTKTKEKLNERIIQLLKIAEKHDICFKWSKCDFNVKKISILKVIVERGVLQSIPQGYSIELG